MYFFVDMQQKHDIMSVSGGLQIDRENYQVLVFVSGEGIYESIKKKFQLAIDFVFTVTSKERRFFRLKWGNKI